LIDLEPLQWILALQASHAWHENKGGRAGKSEHSKKACGRSLLISFDDFEDIVSHQGKIVRQHFLGRMRLPCARN